MTMSLGLHLGLGHHRGSSIGGSPAVTGVPIGMNLTDTAYWRNGHQFLDILRGNDGFSFTDGSTLQSVTSANCDANGWPNTFPSGMNQVQIGCSKALSTATEYEVTWTGSGLTAISLANATITQALNLSTRTIRFKCTNQLPTTDGGASYIRYAFTSGDPNYPRNFTCKPVGSSGEFPVEFTSSLSTLSNGRIRFTKWLFPGVENNSGITAAYGGGTKAAPVTPITWATRNTTSGAQYRANDGVPIELIVALGNLLNRDIHVPLPWNASNDYITGVATYIRDNLAAGLSVYFEVSNEVWNANYKVYTQAINEGTAEGLPDFGFGGGYGLSQSRYTRKIKEFMQLVETVFGTPAMGTRVKRLLCFQHANATVLNAMLGYSDTATYVDVCASAPYMVPSGYATTDTNVADIPGICASLKSSADSLISLAVGHKAVAASYGKAYTTYEGGNEAYFTDAGFIHSLYTNSAMHDVAAYYLQQWERKVNVPLTWFVKTDSSETYGLQTYEGQAINLTNSPKGQGINDYINGKRFPFTLTGTITAAANAADGSSAGTLNGVNSGSTLTITSGGTGLAVDNNGNVTVANHTLLTAGSFSMTVRDTNPGYAAPGYLDSSVSYTITAAIPKDNFNNGTTLDPQWTSGNTLDGLHMAAHNITASQSGGQLTLTSTGTTGNSGGIMLASDVDLTVVPKHFVEFVSNSSGYQVLTYGVPSGDTLQFRIGDGAVILNSYISGSGSGGLASVTQPSFPFYVRFRYDQATDKFFIGACPGTSDPTVNASWSEAATGVARPASIPTTGRVGLIRLCPFGDVVNDKSVFDNYNTNA
jgi:hypothetical protein